MRATIVNLYTIFILAIFPFLMNDGFLDISKTKSDIFIFSTFFMFLFCILISAIENDWRWICQKKNWIIYGVMLVIGITTMSAWNVQYALTGSAGRYQGAFVYWACCLGALCIINFGEWKDYYIDSLIATSVIVSLIAIFNFYEIDVLGILSRIKVTQRHIYISTIGNIDIFSAYLSVVFPVAVVKAISEDILKKRILYNISLVFLFGAILASTCDSPYITLGVLFIVLPFWCLHSAERRERMSGVLLICGIVLLIANVLNQLLKFPLEYVDGILLHFKDMKICIVICLIFFLFYLLVRIAQKVLDKINKKTWHIIWGSFISVASIMAISVYISNVTFDRGWGSVRGFIWMQGWEFYVHQPLYRKLLGIGLDSILPVCMEFFGEEQTIMYGNTHYDNLHNEYLQYLVTTGIIGLSAYMVAMGKVIYSILRGAKDSNTSYAIAMAGICYMMQAIVNISMSSVTAVIMTLLFAGLIINKKPIKKGGRKS